MKSIHEYLSDLFRSAMQEQDLEERFGQVVDSKRPELCQFQCNGALAAAKSAGKNPKLIAETIIKKIHDPEIFSDLSLSGPGFINITLQDKFLSAYSRQMDETPSLGCLVAQSKKVVIDFGGPNVAKPMHVGHLRSAILGDCFQKLARFMGEKVITDNHLGDWGTQMGLLIVSLQESQPSLPYFSEPLPEEFPTIPPVSLQDLEEIYPRASSRSKEDPEFLEKSLKATELLQSGHKGYRALWQHFVDLSVKEMKNDFSRLGVSFDHWLGESFYHERMQSMVARLSSDKKTKISDGAVVIPISNDSDKKEIPPLMLVKTGGGFLYGTSDLATLEYRMNEWSPDEIIYVVDKRQSLHFEQVFRASLKTGITRSSTVLTHAGFGTVNGPDGKPFKTREGGVMKLKDLFLQVKDKAKERMEEAGVAEGYPEEEKNDIAQKVGLSAIKFADLSNHRESNYIFDLDKFTRFEGKTGPYLLYSAVRIKSILRNTNKNGFQAAELLPPTERERPLLLAYLRLPEALQLARKTLQPHGLCEYIYELAQEFNRFYSQCHIMTEKDTALRSSWIRLAEMILNTMETVLGLLGISTPERM